MEKIRKSTCIRQIFAYFLVIAMVFSTIDSTAFYAYAAEPDANIMEVSEGGTTDGAEDTYAGIEFTEDWEGTEISGFEISAWEMDENADFEAEALTILGGLDKTYDIVTLCYRSLADAVSKDLWNAAVAVTDAGNKDYEQIRVNFGSGSEAPDENWCFNNVMETEEAYKQDINLAIDYTVSTENGGGVTVQLDGEAIGLSAFADNVNLCLSTDSMNREDSYLAFQTAFGTENKKLEVHGEDGYAVSTGNYGVDTHEDNSYINVDIHEMHNIVPGAPYQVVEAIYKGVIDDSDENFRRLYLAYYEAGVEVLDEETIIGILGEYAEAGEKFDAVEITNPETETLIIDKDIVNAAAALFPAADGAERPLSFNFRNGENGTNKAWVLINPTANQAEDQTVSSSLTISAENKVEVQASAPTFSAEKYQVIYSFDSNNENYGKLREIFPFEDFSWNLLHIGDGDALGAFLPNLNFVDLVIYVDTDTVWSAEKTYEVVAPPYSGTEFTEERDDGEFSGLEISVWDMDEDTDFEAEALRVLTTLEKTYDIITLTYGYGSGQVSKDVWNAAVAATGAGNKDNEQIRVSFENDSTYMFENWCFTDVAEITQEDFQTVNLSVEYAFSEESNGGATFKMNEGTTDFTLLAGNSNVSIGTDRNYFEEAYNAVQVAFGTEEKSLEVKDSTGNVMTGGRYFTHSDDENSYVDMNVDELQKLTAGEVYSVVEAIYRGDCDSWTEEDGYEFVNLYLHPGNVDKDSFTAEEITSLLSNYGEKSFDEIIIVYCNDAMTGTVSNDVINATLAYLKDSTEERASSVRISFQNSTTGNTIEWILVNPQEQTEDQTLTATFELAEENTKVTVASQTVKADRINLNIIRSRENDSETVSTLEEMYGTGWVQLLVENTDCWASMDSDDWNIWISIDDIRQLTVDTAYAITKYVYKGYVDTWEDGTRELSINFWDNQGEAFTEEQLLDILEEYSTQDEINSIYINQPKSDNNTIYKSVADKACDLLENGGTVKFSFIDPNTEQFVEWHLQNVNPDTEQIADQNVNASLIMGLEENCVYLSVAEQELVAENVMVLFGTSRMNEGEQADEFIMGIFGEETKELETENAETAGWYNVDEWNVIMEFYDPEALADGQQYKVIPKAYRGDVYEFEENGEIIRTVYLSSFAIEENSFTEATFRSTIQYYLDNNIMFDHIFIEQKYSGNNIIKKELINAAREILLDNRTSSIDFGFCACIGEERDENGDIIQEFVQNDMIWELHNPEHAYEDINANVSLNSYGKEGLSVVLAQNDYQVDNINLNFNISPKTGLYKDVLIPTYGEATYEGSGPLVVLENGTELRTDIGAFYTLNPENGNVSFYLCGMQDWLPNTDNRLVQCDYTDIVIPIGEFAEFSFANVTDANTLNIESLTPDIIRVEKTDKVAKVYALKAGEQGYIKATYRIDGKDYIEVISVHTSLETVIEVPEVPDICAVPGVEQTLADIDLNKLVFGDGEAAGSFAWADPTIDLTTLADVDFHVFGATYTNKENKTANINVKVNLIRAEEISLYKGVVYGEEMIPEELDGTIMKVGEELIIGTQVRFNNGAIGSYLESGKVLLQWAPAESLTIDEKYFGVMDVARKFKATEKGKKVFTMSVVCAKSGKVLLSKSATVNVSGTDLFSFDSPEFVFTDVVDEKDVMKGTYTFLISADNYALAKKFTVKSGDTSLLKLDKAKVTKEDGKPVKVEVGYTFKKYGKTAIIVTTADEMKSSTSITCERIDYEPKLLNTTVTLDKVMKIGDMIITELPIAYQKDTSLNGSIVISGEGADKFEVMGNYFITKDTNIAEKTYSLTLEIPIIVESTQVTKTSKQAIKVKVTETKPKVTIKQTKKVNEFYNHTDISMAGVGRITIKTKKCDLLIAGIDEKDSRFGLLPIEGTNDYYIYIKDSAEFAGKPITDEEKKVTINYYILVNGIPQERTTEVTIKTENKKPSLATSDKNTTLYPNVGYVDAEVTFQDKKTKENVSLVGADIKVVLDKKTGEVYSLKDLADTDSTIKVGKNNYKIYTVDEEFVGISLEKTNSVKSTDKITFRIQAENWKNPVDVTYSVKVDVNVPKIKLSSKNLTLNANEDIYEYQTGRTMLEVTGFKNLATFDEVKVTGNEDKFNFNFHPENAELTVTFKEKAPVGNYKCKVETKVLDKTISADLTIKVVDKELAKAVKVVKKGSIDVLRRDTTMITMNPKFTNLSGEIIDFKLKGPDADMFDAFYDEESGNCVVQVKSSYDWDGLQEYKYSTKYNYKVTPVYVLSDNGAYVVEGTQQKVKLTQSKPKITVSSDSTILYADKGDDMTIDFTAISQGEEIAIREIRLLNYTKDLYWDSAARELRVNDEVCEMKKSSGKYTLKFAVVYTDKAGNEKTAQTSYKVTIVR